MANISNQPSAYVLLSAAILPLRLSPRERLLTATVRIGSRYIYELYYEKEVISKTLYDWLLKNGYADGNLIAKWKKQGYEKVRVDDMIAHSG